MLRTMEKNPHDDRKKFSDSTQHLPSWAKLSVEDAEIIEEELSGKKITYGTPKEAADAMTRRLIILRMHKNETLTAMQSAGDNALIQLQTDLNELNSKIIATEQRLSDYQSQDQQRN